MLCFRQLSEEYARRLQQEFDNESRRMSTPNNHSTWDPISEWRMVNNRDCLVLVVFI